MAEEIGSVKVGIEGDYSQLEKVFQDAIALAVSEGKTLAEAMQAAMPILDSAPVTNALQNVGAAAVQTGNELQQSGQQAKGATSIFDQLGAALSAQNSNFQSFANGVQDFLTNPLRFAGESAKSLILELGPIGGIAIAGAAAIAVLGKEVFDLVAEFGAAAEATQNLADRLNLTWRETRNLEEMAQIAGVSISSLTRSSAALAESIDGTGEKAKKTRELLQGLGVTGQDSGELMRNLLVKLSQIPDATERIAIAHQVLGKASQQLIPLLKNYGELQQAVAQLGPAVGDELAGKLTAADDAFDKLNISISRVKESLAAQLAPAIGAIVDGVRTLIVETSKLTRETLGNAAALAAMVPSGLVGTLKDVASTILEIHATFNPFIAGLRGIRAELELFNLAASAISGKAAADFKSGTDAMNKTIGENLHKSLMAATTGTKEFLGVWQSGGGATATAIQAIIDAQAKLSGNVETARAAYNRLNEAFKTGTALADGHKVTSEEVARALANLTAATAAAATTTAAHTEKTKQSSKSLLDMSDGLKILVAQIKEEFEAIGRATTEAAHMNAVFGLTLSTLDVLKLKTAAAAFELGKFSDNIGKIVGEGQLLLSMDAILKTTGDEMKVFTDQVDEANQTALDTSGYAKLQEALKALGITSAADLQRIADEAEQNYQIVLDSGLATYNELSIAALKSVQAQIDLEVTLGEMTREEWEKTTNQIQHDIEALDITHTASTQTRGRNERTLGDEVQAINRKTFDGIARGLAQDIVNQKGWADTVKTIWKGLATDLLNIMFKTLLKPLEDGISKALGGIFGGAAGGAGNAAGAGISGAGGIGGAASGAGGASAASGSFASIFGMVTGAVTAISSVVGNFQMAGMNKSLDLIENYTRYLKIGLVEQGDSLLNDSHVIRNTLTDMMAFNWGVVATQFQSISVSLDKLVSMGGYGTGGGKTAFSGAAAGGPAAGVHIDLRGAKLSGDLTDGQVRTAFDRGFRMSKLGGALRPGVFPQ